MLLCPTHALFFFAEEESREAGEGERTSSWGCREGDDAGGVGTGSWLP